MGDVTAAHGLADIATVAIIQRQVAVDAQTLNLQLNQALNSRTVIELAKDRSARPPTSTWTKPFNVLRNRNLRPLPTRRRRRRRVPSVRMISTRSNGGAAVTRPA